MGATEERKENKSKYKKMRNRKRTGMKQEETRVRKEQAENNTL